MGPSDYGAGTNCLRITFVICNVVVLIFVILEFISAILAFVFSDTARDFFEDNMEKALSDYRFFENATDFDDNVNDAVEFLQDNLKCCGINNYTDWVTFNPDAVSDNGDFPPGDCECIQDDDDNCVPFMKDGVVSVRHVWENGCLDILETGARIYGIVTGVIALIIMFIEIAFVAVAIGLTICITKNRGKNSVV